MNNLDPKSHYLDGQGMSGTVQSHSLPAHSRKPNAARAVSSGDKQRISALDFTKGTLVLFMVLYHWINYFVGVDWPYYRYLRFLSPSFIFISGFMISNVYLSKYNLTDPRLPKRLFVRGLKLILVFVVLNLIRAFVLPIVSTNGAVADQFAKQLNIANLVAICIAGNFSGKIVAFPILIPIAYLLLLSGILMIPQRFYKYTFHSSLMMIFVMIAAVDLMGAKNEILELVAIGMLGVLAGFVRLTRINRVIQHPYLLAFVYLVYTIAISIADVPYPLEIVGTCLSVTIIYLIGTSTWHKPYWIWGEVLLLGRYSLLGYISQIAVLQILAVILRHFHLGSALLAISCFLAFSLTIVSVEFVDRARVANGSADRLYRAIFS